MSPKAEPRPTVTAMGTAWRAMQLLSEFPLRSVQLATALGLKRGAGDRMLSAMSDAGFPLKYEKRGRFAYYFLDRAKIAPALISTGVLYLVEYRDEAREWQVAYRGSSKVLAQEVLAECQEAHGKPAARMEALKPTSA